MRFIYFSLFLFIAVHTNAQIIINEISYNSPEAGDDSLEYIEIYNAGPDHVEITGWYFTSGIEDTLPVVHLSGGQYYVTAVNASAMQSVYGINVHQWSDGALNNSGELITLVDNNGNFVDSVRYDDSTPWPTEPDGNGPSLELISSASDNGNGVNWQFSTGVTGVTINGNEVRGTPGAQNSTGGTPVKEIALEKINMYPNPADNDVVLHSEYLIERIKLYSLDGRIVLDRKENGYLAHLSISGLTEGLYVVKAQTPEGIWTSLLSVMK